MKIEFKVTRPKFNLLSFSGEKVTAKTFEGVYYCSGNSTAVIAICEEFENNQPKDQIPG